MELGRTSRQRETNLCTVSVLTLNSTSFLPEPEHSTAYRRPHNNVIYIYVHVRTYTCTYIYMYVYYNFMRNCCNPRCACAPRVNESDSASAKSGTVRGRYDIGPAHCVTHSEVGVSVTYVSRCKRLPDDK